MKKIIHALRIHAGPAAVHEALTTAEGVRGWWTTKASVEPQEGGSIHFTFHGDFNPRMRQTRIEPGRRVEWLCTGGHSNWQDNRFRFVLDERDGETMLLFVQEYAQELDDETYGVYNFNWGYYLNSLKKLCETGAGSPFEAPS